MAEPVKSFVATALAKGMSRDQISQVLLQGGWPVSMVNEFLGKVQAPPAVSEPILQCKGLGYRAARLSDIDLDIGKGELFGIVAASGGGKSTLLGLLSGLLQPNSGDVRIINGRPISLSRDASARKLVGYSPQNPSVYDDLTVVENLEHAAAIHGLALHGQSLLKFTGISQKANVITRLLSAGEKRRLDIACALVHSPKILFLDDPLARVDAEQQRELLRLLRAIVGKGITVVIASSFLAELEPYCDRIGILRGGRISEIGRPDDLRLVYSRNFEIRLRTESGDYSQLVSSLTSQAGQAAMVRKEGNFLYVQTPTPTSALKTILQSVDEKNNAIISIQVGRPAISEVLDK